MFEYYIIVLGAMRILERFLYTPSILPIRSHGTLWDSIIWSNNNDHTKRKNVKRYMLISYNNFTYHVVAYSQLPNTLLTRGSRSSSQPQGACPQDGQQPRQTRSQHGLIRFLPYAPPDDGSASSAGTQGGCNAHDNNPRSCMCYASHQGREGRCH